IRHIANGDALAAVWQRHGFVAQVMEDKTLAEQAALMRGARLIGGIHGAGLANMLFMPRGGSVIEIRQIERVPDCFFTLASALGHRYFLVEGQGAQEGVHPHAADLLVDPAALDRALEAAAGA
ncbi:MAG: glycosyltransferase family 61 protein, partial [Rhizobiaceae bacterium]